MSRKQKIWLACVLLYVSIVIVIKWVQYEDPDRVKQELVLRLDEYKAAQEYLAQQLQRRKGETFAYAPQEKQHERVVPLLESDQPVYGYLEALEESELITSEGRATYMYKVEDGAWFYLAKISSGLVLKDYYHHYIVYEPNGNLAGLPQNQKGWDRRTIYYKEPLDKHWTYVIEEELFD